MPRGIIFLNFQKLCCSLVVSCYSIEFFVPLVLGLMMDLGPGGKVLVGRGVGWFPTRSVLAVPRSLH